jgi:hypothetical protein
MNNIASTNYHSQQWSADWSLRKRGQNARKVSLHFVRHKPSTNKYLRNIW